MFVPVFVELLDKEGRERAWEVASAIINLSVVVLTAVTIIGVLGAPWIAKFYASRLHGSAELEQQRILAFMLRLFIPQIIFYGFYAVTTGLLNAHRRFGAPMYTPIRAYRVLNVATSTVARPFAAAASALSARVSYLRSVSASW